MKMSASITLVAIMQTVVILLGPITAIAALVTVVIHQIWHALVLLLSKLNIFLYVFIIFFIDIDECVSNSSCSGAHEVCKNIVGSFYCPCAKGYNKTDGINCTGMNRILFRIYKSPLPSPFLKFIFYLLFFLVDIDECQNPSNCNAQNGTCYNMPGTFLCSCLPGYTGNGTICVDRNECLQDPCANHSTCVNLVPGYRCDCYPGYSGSPCIGMYGRSCNVMQANIVMVDINECFIVGANNCSANQVCVNTPGSFNCDCASGYQPQGAGACAGMRLSPFKLTI